MSFNLAVVQAASGGTDRLDAMKPPEFRLPASDPCNPSDHRATSPGFLSARRDSRPINDQIWPMDEKLTRGRSSRFFARLIGCNATNPTELELRMSKLHLVFLAIALAAGAIGFSGAAGPIGTGLGKAMLGVFFILSFITRVVPQRSE